MRIEKINNFFGRYAERLLRTRWWTIAAFAAVLVVSVVGMKRMVQENMNQTLNDQLHAIVGLDYLHGDRGTFALYNRNAELWIKLKYIFFTSSLET